MSGLQDGLDGYNRMRLQMENAMTNVGRVAGVGRRLTENLASNRPELNDETRREELVGKIAEVSQSASQPVSQSASQSASQSVSQSVGQSVSQSVSQSACTCSRQSVSKQKSE